MTFWRVITGDCRDVLATLPAASVHTCVTSPPYFGLRDYGTGEWEGGDPACGHRVRERPSVGTSTLDGGKGTVSHQQEGFSTECPRCGARRVDRQIGLEPTPDEFVAALVEVFREVRRVLRDDGTVWLNLGDSYASAPPGIKTAERYKATGISAPPGLRNGVLASETADKLDTSRLPGIKPKDLLGIPWMVAFALRADGWYLRSDIIWAKPNPMPESVTDRPTKAHEYVFLLSKSPRYFYDADAIREDAGRQDLAMPGTKIQAAGDEVNDRRTALTEPWQRTPYRNRRSVWTVATQPYAGSHFATFPPKLIEPCVLAGAPERVCGECGAPWVRVVEREKHPERDVEAQRTYYAERTGRTDGAISGPGGMVDNVRTLGFEPSCSHGDGNATGVVLDPFAGAGTTGMVALQHGRSFVGIELNSEYAEMARWRIRDDAPLLNGHTEIAA